MSGSRGSVSRSLKGEGEEGGREQGGRGIAEGELSENSLSARSSFFCAGLKNLINVKILKLREGHC